jgi:hypothetical protein
MAKQEHKSKKEQEQLLSKELDKELEMSFPASDPPASTQPGSGITGPEPTPKKAQGKKGAREDKRQITSDIASIAESVGPSFSSA